MAKVSFINRQTKRQRMVANDAPKRAELKAKIVDERCRDCASLPQPQGRATYTSAMLPSAREGNIAY